MGLLKNIKKDVGKIGKKIESYQKNAAERDKAEVARLKVQLEKEKLISKIDKEKNKRNKNKPKNQEFGLFGV